MTFQVSRTALGACGIVWDIEARVIDEAKAIRLCREANAAADMLAALREAHRVMRGIPRGVADLTGTLELTAAAIAKAEGSA